MTIYPQDYATGDGSESNPWANDCIKKAYNACPVDGTIYLKKGYYQLSGKSDINKKINIIGEGMGKAIIKTANTLGFQIDADYCSIRDFTVDGDAQTDGNSSMVCINSSGPKYLSYKNIEAKNAGYYGVNFNDVSNCIITDIHSHDNYRHGMHSGANYANTNQHNLYENIFSWNNGNLGFAERGGFDSAFNIFKNLTCWNNGSFGIGASTQKNGSILLDSLSYENGEAGIRTTGNYDFTIENCYTHSNKILGIYLSGGDNINFVNVISKNNGLNGANDCGINIKDTQNVVLSGCQLYDDRDNPFQQYAIFLQGTTKTVTLTNCILTPNKVTEIKNIAPEAVVTIITE